MKGDEIMNMLGSSCIKDVDSIGIRRRRDVGIGAIREVGGGM